MIILKSQGVSPTERLLAELCDRTFLRLWSYPNPVRDDGKELCDLLVVFQNEVLIFFDRENRRFDQNPENVELAWNRWHREVIDKQVATAHGAERYIRSGRSIYLDPQKKQQFPIPIDSGQVRCHKIVVAHGAKEACKRASTANVLGSLAISYGEKDERFNIPFFVQIDRKHPVHILDTQNLEIALTELDTIFDFTAYLDAKLEAIQRHALSYCGEEDLIAHYFRNFDEEKNRHMIGTLDAVDFVHIGEGEWFDFERSEAYARRKAANKTSYFWDELLQITSNNALMGVLGGNSEPFHGKSALHFMAMEPRFSRRSLSDIMLQSIRNFPESDEPLVRNVSLMPSFYEGMEYVFLQIKASDDLRNSATYREVRSAMLEIACGAAKLRTPTIKRVVGIATDAPKFAGKTNSEDLILMEFDGWNAERRAYYEKANEELRFFRTPQMQVIKQTVSEFPRATTKTKARAKKGRNELCFCGSSLKYKKCCGR